MRGQTGALLWIGLAGMWVMLSGEVVELDPVVVEGRHFDELAMALPLGVKRIERSEIDGSGVRNISEVLERLAGVRIVDTVGNGSTGEVALRGFGDNSGLRVLILVDGQVYNPPDMGGINWTGIEIGQLETVEVLRGGQTVLYGNHAVSGVIKLTTRKPGESLESEVYAGTGSYGEYRVKAWSAGRAGNVGLRAGASWQGLDGYREHASMESLTANLAWETGSRETANWTGRVTLSRNSMELPGPLSFEQMQENPRRSSSGNDQVDAQTLQVTQFGEGATSWGRWEAATGFLQRKREWNLDGRTADNDLTRLTLNPRIRIPMVDGYLITGVDTSYDVIDHLGYLDSDREVILSKADLDRISIGGYLFASHDLNEAVNFSGGVRMESTSTDNHNDHFMANQLLPELETNRGTFPNPFYRNPPELDPARSYAGRIDKSGWAAEASLVWSVSQEISIWCGWDRVYRYPSLDETAAYQGYPLSDPLNERLDPETGNNYEVGIKHAWQRWRTGLTVFYLELNKEISFVEYEDPDGAGLVRLNTNIGNSIRKGIEASIAYQDGNYGGEVMLSLIDATLESSAAAGQVPLVPGLETTATLWLKLLETVRLQTYISYRSEQVQGNDFNNEFRRIPEHFLAHASLSWDVADRVDVVAGVNNLFDKTYATAAYNGGFYPGTGRQAHITLKMVF